METLPITQDFLAKVKTFNEDWYQRYRDIGAEPTPQVDGTGKKIINKKGSTGYDYIEETYMRDMLDKHFPGWSQTMAAPLHFLGAEWVVAQIDLAIVDVGLLAFGISPPVRHFYGVDSVRIQFKKDTPHLPENIIDVGDNCKQAVTSAVKFAINRMTRIGDDIYGKRLEYDGAGTYESIVETNPTAEAFGNWVTSHKGNWSEILDILKVKEMSQVTDWEEAYKKVKEKKGW